MHKTISFNTGNDYFQQLALFCNIELSYDLCIIATKFNNNQIFSSIAVCENGKIQNNFKDELTNIHRYIYDDDNYFISNDSNSGSAELITFYKYEAVSFSIIPIRNNKNITGVILLINQSQKKINTDEIEIITNTLPRIKSEFNRLEYELKIKENEEFSNGILASISSGIVVIDNYGEIIKTNEAWLTFLETFELNNINCFNYYELIPKLFYNNNIYSTKTIHGIKSILNGEATSFQQEYFYTKANSKKWFLITASRLANSENMTVIRHVDVTKSKIREEIISKNEETYRNLIQHSKEIIFTLNTFNKLIFCNSNYLKKIHFDDTNNESEKFTNNLKYPSSVNFLKALNRSIIEKKAQNITIEIKSKNNKSIYLKGTIVPIFKNNIIDSYQCYFKDITKIINAEIEITKTENRYRDILDNLNDAVIIRNKQNKIIYANQSFYALFGVLKDDKTFISMIDLIEPGWYTVVNNTYRSALSKPTSELTIEYKAKKRNNQIIWVKEKIRTYNDLNNKQNLLSILSDITDIKSQETEMQNLVNDLSSRNNEMLQFNYIVSHNLRAPIANITGLVDLIEQKVVKDNEHEVVIKHIKDSTTKLDEIIKDLNSVLDAKTTSSKNKEEFDIKEVINTVYTSLELQILNSKADFDLTFQDNFPMINSIKSYYTSILYNLISNSIKFRSNQRKLQISMQFSFNNNEITLIYTDNGIGFDIQSKSKDIFKLYKRFNTEIEGKGLGLHMTKIQIEALKGKIELQSEINKGSTFSITIPNH